jgi:alcohol dehydrogenase
LSLAGMSDGEVMGSLNSRLNDFRSIAGVTDTLGDMGVSKGDIPMLAERALEDPCLFTNPRRPTKRDIETVYEKAI